MTMPLITSTHEPTHAKDTLWRETKESPLKAMDPATNEWTEVIGFTPKGKAVFVGEVATPDDVGRLYKILGMTDEQIEKANGARPPAFSEDEIARLAAMADAKRVSDEKAAKAEQTKKEGGGSSSPEDKK
jgi:hypothetical protein